MSPPPPPPAVTVNQIYTPLVLTFLSLFIFTQFSTATSHTSLPPQSASFSEWRSARATYYAASDPRDSVGGACGYGDLAKAGYGMATVGVSETLFRRGQICGACFQLRCVEDLRWCIPGTSVIVTVTNFCAPNYGFPADGGGHCNPPNDHFVLPIEAFEKIAIWKAGNMPIRYRRQFDSDGLRIPFFSCVLLLLCLRLICSQENAGYPTRLPQSCIKRVERQKQKCKNES